MAATPTIPRPVALPVIAEDIPAEMKARAQWVVWRYTWKKQKWDKPPYNARTGRLASSTDADTWSSWEEAWGAYQAGGWDGVGYVFSGEDGDFCGFDLDHCVGPATGLILPWTADQRSNPRWYAHAPDPERLLAEFFRTYAELSPSGTGVKGLFRAPPFDGGKSGDFEMYAMGRYFTVTGHRLPPASASIEDCSDSIEAIRFGFFQKPAKKSTARLRRSPEVAHEPHVEEPRISVESLIAKARSAQNGAKFEALFSGDWNGYPSPSEADLALCSIIAFYAGHDTGLIDAVFRKSGLYREKWDEKHCSDGRTYGEMTFENAIGGATEFYSPARRGKLELPTESVGDLQLAVRGVKKTAAKTTLEVHLCRDGKALDVLSVSSTPSSRKANVKTILARMGDSQRVDAHQVDAVVGQLLATGTAARAKATDQEGETIADIIAEIVPAEIKLVYRTVSGRAFSESCGEIARSAYVDRFSNNRMLAAIAGATDAQTEDGEVSRGALVGMLERELRLLWGDMISRLPTIDEAEIDLKSKTAELFRAAVLSVWAKPANMSLVKQAVSSGMKTDSVQLAVRTSLISKVQALVNADKVPPIWTCIQGGFSAWVRQDPEKAAKGEIEILLGMRWELGDQIGRGLPLVNNQLAFRRLGAKCGVLREAGVVTEHTDGGDRRLAVLSESLTNELLYTPSEDSVVAQNPPESVRETDE